MSRKTLLLQWKKKYRTLKERSVRLCCKCPINLWNCCTTKHQRKIGMVYTVILSKKYGLCFFHCHCFTSPYRCAVFKISKLYCSHYRIPCTTSPTSLHNWNCPKILLRQTSQALESPPLSWLLLRECSRRAWCNFKE